MGLTKFDSYFIVNMYYNKIMRKYTRQQWLEKRNDFRKNVILVDGVRKYHLGDRELLNLANILDIDLKDKYENLLYDDHMRSDEPNWMRMFYRDYQCDNEWRNYVKEGRLQESETVPILKDVYHMLDTILVTFNKYNELLTETKALTNTLIERYG